MTADDTPVLIDTRELARTAGTRAGTLAIAAMPRLASSLSRDDGRLHWQVRGECRGRPDGGSDDLLHLEFAADVLMQCVRCLGEVPVALRGERSFRMVASEEEAAREDIDDVQFDVLPGARRFDLAALLEDEAIMALPPVGRHDDCELPAVAALRNGTRSGADAGADGGTDGSGNAGEDAGGAPAARERPASPFAGLAELKKRRH